MAWRRIARRDVRPAGAAGLMAAPSAIPTGPMAWRCTARKRCKACWCTTARSPCPQALLRTPEDEQLAQRPANLTMPPSTRLLPRSETSGGVNNSVAYSVQHPWQLANMRITLVRRHSTLQRGSCWHTRSNSKVDNWLHVLHTYSASGGVHSKTAVAKHCWPLSHASTKAPAPGSEHA